MHIINKLTLKQLLANKKRCALRYLVMMEAGMLLMITSPHNRSTA